MVFYCGPKEDDNDIIGTVMRTTTVERCVNLIRTDSGATLLIIELVPSMEEKEI